MNGEAVSAQRVRPLRAEVLRPGRPAEDAAFDGDELADTLHALISIDGVAAGVASVMRSPHPRDPDPGDWRIRGMATAPDHRGRGVGSSLLSMCEQHARSRGGARLWCNARVAARTLYERAGMAAECGPFEIAGIGPHLLMSKALAASRSAPPALVIFDCDGVLVDSERISNGVLARMLGEQGLAHTLEQARAAYQGLLLTQVLERAQQQLGRDLPPGWLARYERERSEAFRLELEPVPGAAEAVHAARSGGAEVCVASQGSLEKTRLSLQLTGLLGLFEQRALFSAAEVPRGKPHPDLFLHAAAKMAADPQRCVVVEDSASGVRAAVRAHMEVFGLAADSDEIALERAGARIIHSLSELAPAIGA